MYSVIASILLLWQNNEIVNFFKRIVCLIKVFMISVHGWLLPALGLLARHYITVGYVEEYIIVEGKRGRRAGSHYLF